MLLRASHQLWNSVSSCFRASRPSRAPRRGSRLHLSPTQFLEPRTLLTTGLVRNIHPTFNSTPLDIVDVNGTLFFSADDGTNGRELWKSDGTAGGTVLVKDVNPGPNGSMTPLPNASRISFLTNVNGILYFVADDGVHGNELWKSDGTGQGTVLVKDINPTSTGSTSFGPEELINLNGTLYFYANDGVHGEELWRSDGTESGTVMVKDIYSGAFGSVSESFFSSGLRVFQNKLIFSADNGSSNGEELWVSDGTTNGTVMLKDLTGDFFSSSPDDFTVVGNTMFFTAFDFNHGSELWKTDGTAQGTVLVKDIVPGFFDAHLIELTAVGNTLFFSANTSDTGYELWKSNGTESGTVLVKDIQPGTTGSIFGLDDSFTDVNGVLFFAADDGVHGEEIWKSDGTESGTVLVKDIYAGSNSSYTGLPIAVGDQYYFQAFTLDDGFELWRTDGTSQGTVMLRAIDANFRATVPVTAEFLTLVDGVLYFQAVDDALSTWTELWRFDPGPIVPPPPPPPPQLPNSVGVWREGKFYLDTDHNGVWSPTGDTDQLFSFGLKTDTPVVGDWNGDGVTDLGVWRYGKFYLDANGNHTWDTVLGGDLLFSFGTASDLPIAGDWNGDGKTDVGTFRAGKFYLDANGNHKWDGPTGGDQTISFGSTGDLPVIGDWNGDGTTDIGILRAGKFYLDANGNRAWNNIAGGDAYFNFGTVGDKPIVGDWNHDGKSDVGIVRNGTYFLDGNGNRAWNNTTGGDLKFKFGSATDIPISGLWQLPPPAPTPTSSSSSLSPVASSSGSASSAPPATDPELLASLLATPTKKLTPWETA